ncbi:hypothetical protein [Sunxiuqinia indica]|uniref:hypothetical protein n=1 Tax=Sunxiuqinia indica TaxID=2692584 RepID=UPI00135A8BEB|nr:hypothetical protein [Sunxiuqinia indica]
MKLEKLSLADLEVLETRLWNLFYRAAERMSEGKEDQIPVKDLLETKLNEIKLEINSRIDNLINED